MERLIPHRTYEIKPSAGSFQAIYLGEAVNPQKKNKHIILTKSGNNKPKLYCFDKFELNDGVVERVCLRDLDLKRYVDDPKREFCKGLLEKAGI
jgi:hypothetical protein